ncbi:ATP-binding cassette domain-containing protein, partial [Thermosipho sp. (in: thermotogales)]|uniref:ATP-binding cassette domain-containing protein n=1 Tax=Thermosipho sp. (in: thermotogales) TaxID=1968895 RepID=UPI00338EFC8F
MVGLFGESGIGKSTVVKIILGLLGIEKDYVFVNDMPLNKIEINSYYSRIGYLPQHSILFKGTVKENILLGEEKSLDDKLLEFLDYL